MVCIMEPNRLRRLMDEALEQSNKAWVVKQPHQDSQPSTSEALIHCASRSDHSLTEVDEDGSTGGESDEGTHKNSGFRKTWTFEEDDLLSRLVQEYGPREWAQIAENFNGRSAKQCHQRWHYCLDPKINRGGWTGAEDRLILKYQRLHGNRWSKIAKLMSGRTGYAVRNRYNCIMKQGKVTTGKKHERSEDVDTDSNSGDSNINSDLGNNDLRENKKRNVKPEALRTSAFSPFAGMANIASHARSQPSPLPPGSFPVHAKTSQAKASEGHPHFPARSPHEMAASLLQLHQTSHRDETASPSAALLALSNIDNASHGKKDFGSIGESGYYKIQSAQTKPSYIRHPPSLPTPTNHRYSPISSSRSVLSSVAHASPPQAVFSPVSTCYMGSYDTPTYTRTHPAPSASSSYMVGYPPPPYPVTRPTGYRPPPTRGPPCTSAESLMAHANLLNALTKMATKTPNP